MSSSPPDKTREIGHLDPYTCTQIEDIISVGRLGELDCVGSELEAAIKDWPPGSYTAVAVQTVVQASHVGATPTTY